MFCMHVMFGGRLRIVSMQSLTGMLKSHRHDWRDVTSGIRALVYDTLLVRSACRLTLPTDESSVKTILLKMRWIDLISSSFTPYQYSIYPLTFTCFNLLPYLLQV